MLDRLKKHLGIAEVSTDVSAIQTELETLKVQFDGVQSNLANAVETINALTAEKEGLEVALADAIETNASLKAQVEDKEAAIVKAKDDSRKEALVKVVGEQKADATFEAVKGLDDVAFDAVLAAMSAAYSKEATSELFVETGVAGDVEPAKTITAEEKILRAKFSK